MSIKFQEDINPAAKKLLEEAFKINAMDKRNVLFEKPEVIDRRKMAEIANAAGQVVEMELNDIGDRKEVGGVVYELDEKGWKRLPIGTTLDE